MMQEKRTLAPSDAELVAYLDGELSPADSVRIGQQIAIDRKLVDRVELLMNGARPFREAFDPLLSEAPMDRLDLMMSAAVDRYTPAPHRFWTAVSRNWPAAIAAGLAFMVIGAGADRFAVTPIVTSLLSKVSSANGSDDWRRAVAQYLSLYTSDTLSIIPDTGTAKQQELASVGSKLGMDLTLARVELPGLALKRAEMFDYDGKALGFLAYLDPQSGPVSLCIIDDPQGKLLPEVEHRRGMNVVYWSGANHGFMLIGRASVDRLQALASIVADRFNGNGAERAADDHG
jgi:hypothetical protein